MTDSDQQRTRLETLREELRERRERLAAHGRDGVPADFEEQVTARENDDVVASLKVQVDGELRQVEAALQRLDSGDYGRCTRCGEDIDPARLDVLPWAMHCSACAD
ncbi:MAG: TraR/DksA C4-type zinc finger protein [Gammaproteobacteria bacterium]